MSHVVFLYKFPIGLMEIQSVTVNLLKLLAYTVWGIGASYSL
jgi:hypothetical protein